MTGNALRGSLPFLVLLWDFCPFSRPLTQGESGWPSVLPILGVLPWPPCTRRVFLPTIVPRGFIRLREFHLLLRLPADSRCCELFTLAPTREELARLDRNPPNHFIGLRVRRPRRERLPVLPPFIVGAVAVRGEIAHGNALVPCRFVGLAAFGQTSLRTPLPDGLVKRDFVLEQ